MFRVTVCNLIAAFSMASSSSGTGSSSARISSVLRGSAGNPLRIVRPVQSVTVVFRVFWDLEPIDVHPMVIICF